MEHIVIVGGGHAAAQLCSSLTEEGWSGQVTLVSEEEVLPYHRPPLSKTFIKSSESDPQLLRPEQFYTDSNVRLLLGSRADRIDRDRRQLVLQAGDVLNYDKLVLATGMKVRRLPRIPSDIANVHYLRTLRDAEALRHALSSARNVKIVGAGFIGLEIAATARQMGKDVSVFEVGPRVLGRAVSRELSSYIEQSLKDSGVSLTLNALLEDFQWNGNQLVAMRANGKEHTVDLLIVGIGAEPEATLAETAGLDCDDGILVNAFMETSDPNIYAIGDCVRFPSARQNTNIRLESVQNANDQARTLSAVLCRQPVPYSAIPWFWSEQGSLRIQIAGLTVPGATIKKRSGTKPESFSFMHFVRQRLVCVESVNAPADHIAARKLLEKDVHPSTEVLIDASVALRSHL